MKLVFVSGPFRSLSQPYSHWEQEQNVRRAEALALDVWLAGHVAIVPHLLTRHFQGAADDRVWLDGDLAIMERCDAVLLTPDWERSAGARVERSYALAKGMPVFESLEELTQLLGA